jgi:thiamine monophosphate kinase
MMDTSDGVLSTLHTLCALNRIGLQWKWNNNCLASAAQAFVQTHDLPQFALMVAEHGDFALLACIREADLSLVQALGPIHILGQFSETPEIRLHVGDQTFIPALHNAHLLHETPVSQWSHVCRSLLQTLREAGYP